MNTNRIWSFCTALVFAAPVAGQQAQPQAQQTEQPRTGMMGDGMAQMMPMGPASLLGAADQLELTEAQRAELTALEEKLHAEHTMHVQAAGAQEMAAAGLLEAQTPDWQAYEQALAEAANHRVKAHVAMTRVASEADAVLTPEQATRLHHAMGMVHAMMPGGMGAMMGMMQAGMGHTTMSGQPAQDDAGSGTARANPHAHGNQ
jgi:Spy/CpxP family protein refolding chaperone